MLMRSISGIRGIVGEGLTAETLVDHIRAFLAVTQAKSVVVGRDARSSGEAIERLVCSVCELSGVDVYPLGLATTPTVEIAVEQKDASGGIIITASHNPSEWNALKFLNADGTFLLPAQVKEMLALADEQKGPRAAWDQLGTVHANFNADREHIDNILGLSFIDVDAIRAKKWKVGCDLVNGAASKLLPQLLSELGCEVYSIYDQPDGKFPRGGEPTPENLGDLGKLVKDMNCAVGFATDPDADRCALVEENGQPMGEEYTLALAMDVVLPKAEGNAAVNLSTSLLNDTVAAKYNRSITRTAVGEINVSSYMREQGFPIGGEGNGGVILADSHFGRDAMVAAALVLQWMTETGKTLSEFKNALPPFKMVKDKLPVGNVDVDVFLAKVKDKWKEATLSELDGLHLMLDGAWIHLRKSNTEPIFRIITESSKEGEAEALAQAVKDLL